ncbi:MAG: restriction endonuclease [Minisyncoccota bacterium]
MKKISFKRIGEYLQTAMRIAVEHGGSFPTREIMEEMEKRLQFDDYEKAIYEKSGYVRWQSYLHFYSIDATKAGWLRKHKGVWYVTEEGQKVLSFDPEKFIEAARTEYKKWAAAREHIEEPDAAEAAQAPVAMGYEQAQSTAQEEIKAYIRALNPYDFQDLVAALFRGMGYYTPFVAPKGPDGGIDIVAYKDPIGAQQPRVRVQVKHRPDTKVSSAEVAALMGVLQGEGYVGIMVSSGGFSADAVADIRRAARHIEKIDLERLIDLWEEHYDKLTDEDKGLLPLRRLSFLAPEE